LEWVAGLNWNQWPKSIGMGGRFTLESVAELPRNTAKRGLARAINRDKILARFAIDYEKTQEAKAKGTPRTTRTITRRAARKAKAVPSVPGPTDSATGDEGGSAMSPGAEAVSPYET
jgi:hypothetical protein